ncbi:ribonuclease HIII [Bacillus massilinigeriensis]|uniref:ribonuclease HIII n=1 Tax=Bacillus mediterraneensis TaxID=1805474 RepID=UPI0008F95D42|nr:ribonuclease HIII [Bacillus mediterraneensis]
MGNTVLKKGLKEINSMKDYYKSFLTENVPPGAIFSAKTALCSITAYKSGKVLFQGKGGMEEAAKWGNPEPSGSENKLQKSGTSALPPNLPSMSVIGSDEVGTGDYFGPITVCAAYARSSDLALLKELGVQDSKNLKDDRIIEIAKQLVTFLPYSLLTLKNEKYNELQKSGMSQGKMKGLLHNQAIQHLLNKIAPEEPEAILIDQFAQKEVYYNYLKGQPTIVRDRVYFSTKAEGIHLAVAAASMIARYAFVQRFDALSKEAGFIIPKGAGAQVDIAAAKLIKSKGAECLNEFVKLHFANTDKAMKLSKK